MVRPEKWADFARVVDGLADRTNVISLEEEDPCELSPPTERELSPLTERELEILGAMRSSLGLSAADEPCGLPAMSPQASHEETSIHRVQFVTLTPGPLPRATGRLEHAPTRCVTRTAKCFVPSRLWVEEELVYTLFAARHGFGPPVLGAARGDDGLCVALSHLQECESAVGVADLVERVASLCFGLASSQANSFQSCWNYLGKDGRGLCCALAFKSRLPACKALHAMADSTSVSRQKVREVMF